MFVYEIGCNFYSMKGMIRIFDYILLSKNDENGFYLSHILLQKFLIKSFINARACGWGGKIINKNYIGISVIPMIGDVLPLKLLAFKQDNNDPLFLVSEHAISVYGNNFGKLLNYNTEISPDKLMYYFDESYDLVQQLFSVPLQENNTEKTIKPIDNIADTDESKNSQQNDSNVGYILLGKSDSLFKGIDEKDFF